MFDLDNDTLATLMVVFIVCGPAALVLAVIMGFRMAASLGKIRKQARRGHDIAARVEGEYERLLAREEEHRRRLDERFRTLETDLRERMERCERVANGTRERLVQLETYLKEFFEVELKSVFESFDRTVTSILEEMKSELLRGVDRIEEIQAVVDSKTFAQDRILEGEGSVYRMISDTGTGGKAGETGAEAKAGDAGVSLEDDEAAGK